VKWFVLLFFGNSVWIITWFGKHRRFLVDIFCWLNLNNDLCYPSLTLKSVSYNIQAYMLELYQDNLVDLLLPKNATRQKLEIKKDSKVWKLLSCMDLTSHFSHSSLELMIIHSHPIILLYCIFSCTSLLRQVTKISTELFLCAFEQHLLYRC
jgi:hypothetical protein